MMPRPSPSGFNSSSAKPSSADPLRAPDPGESEQRETPYDPGFDAIFAALQARFAERAAGLPAKFSTDLALDIVLNDVVEQACLATGASGAAIALERDQELVCRASSGTGAPELGARISREAGVVAECIRSGRMLCCDDAENDPRADAAACRSLGVRSVMALPLWQSGGVVGVLAVFSSRAAAFGDRDQRTLEALSQSVLASLARAAKPPSEPDILNPQPTTVDRIHAATAADPVATDQGVAEHPRFDHALLDQAAMSEEWQAPSKQRGRGVSNRVARIATWILVPTVVASAILLVTITGEILLGKRRIMARPAEPSSRAASNSASSGSASLNSGGAANAQAAANARAANPTTAPAGGNISTGAGGAENAASLAGASRSNAVPPGGLAVYENGKEVFRMPPKTEETTPSGAASSGTAASSKTDVAGGAVSTAEAPAIYELSTQAAEENLLHRVEPEYPSQARQQQIQGQVVLNVHIAPNGTVEDVLVVSGHPLLVRAAMDAVKQWRFRPHLVDGHAVEMQARLALNFKLSR